MADYLLFIDTETSGLPKKWNLPYSSENNWPYIVQLSWIIYTSKGVEVKRENHFINNDDFEISATATRIHGITRKFINENGWCRKEVLSLLTNDLNAYQPLVVGYFMQLDLHMIGADCYRAGMENPLVHFPCFCTMLATSHLVENPATKYLSLCELHKRLFHTAPSNYHNAIEDAQATARCFFEMLSRGDLNEQKIAEQKNVLEEPHGKSDSNGCGLAAALLVLLMVLICIV